MICSLTEHGIVLSQVEQFDVLDLYKTCMYYHSSYFGSIDGKIHWCNCTKVIVSYLNHLISYLTTAQFSQGLLYLVVLDLVQYFVQKENF